MRNTLAAGLSAAILCFAVLGCGSINPFAESGKSNTPANRPGSSAIQTNTNTIANTNANANLEVGKTGVRECDELVDSLAIHTDNPDDNFAVRAAKNYAMRSIRDSVKQAIEDNKNNLSDLTRRCQDIKLELDRAKASPARNQ